MRCYWPSTCKNTFLGSGHKDAQYKIKNIYMNLPLSGYDVKCVGIYIYLCQSTNVKAGMVLFH